MAEIEIRPAVASDIVILEKIDHSSETTHVWRIDSNVTSENMSMHSNKARLPRALKLSYPRRNDSLRDTWTHHLLFLIARCGNELVGYLTLDANSDLLSAVVRDLVVSVPMRRQGIGSALVLSAQDWVKKRGMTRLVLEVPAKNHAYNEFARKLRFNYSGLMDNYYANHEMVLFYLNILK